MNVLDKLIFYTPKIIHVLLLPMLYVVILWFPNGRYWEVIGLIILLLIPFIFFIRRFDIRVYYKFIFPAYLIAIILFFPFNIFEDGVFIGINNFFNYHSNVILVDIMLMFFVDLWFFRCNRQNSG